MTRGTDGAKPKCIIIACAGGMDYHVFSTCFLNNALCDVAALGPVA